MTVLIHETAGRELCPACGGDSDGTPCSGCGGGGLLPFVLPPCPHTYFGGACGSVLERAGWHPHSPHAVGSNVDDGNEDRLPLFLCDEHGHQIAIRFTPVEERRAA